MAGLTYPAAGKRNPPQATRALSKTGLTYAAIMAIFAGSAFLALEYRHQGMFDRPHRMGLAADLAYYDLPRVTTAMGGGSNGPKLRADIALEVAKSDLDVMEDFQPRITDRVNSYLASLDPDELNEPSAMPGIKKELLHRINSVGMPMPVHDLMFRQLLVM